jgi:hypothetical protein
MTVVLIYRIVFILRKMQIEQFRQKQKELLTYFTTGKNLNPSLSPITIKILHFNSEGLDGLNFDKDSYIDQDTSIKENKSFYYPVFIPYGSAKSKSFILLLHGLNERKWDKYLYWAEYLTLNTGKPVVLFPLAFHINRSPFWWGDPRLMWPLLKKRSNGSNRSISFANAALSERLTEEPSRFFGSGFQTILDIISLTKQIKSGINPVFKEDAAIDIFSYSIGSFLAEILLMADPFKLFTNSRLFIFCGGSIFSGMYGESRYIMDKTAYDRLFSYYCSEWFNDKKNKFRYKEMVYYNILSAFNTMIRPDKYKKEREMFFNDLKGRIFGISLLKDKVMPWSGVEDCMGSQLVSECFSLIDFPYSYSHESPFPVNSNIDDNLLNSSFREVFKKAVAFLV